LEQNKTKQNKTKKEKKLIALVIITPNRLTTQNIFTTHTTIIIILIRKMEALNFNCLQILLEKIGDSKTNVLETLLFSNSLFLF
jgi:hypothetical protein